MAASWNMLCYAIALGVLSIPAVSFSNSRMRNILEDYSADRGRSDLQVVANIGVVPFILINLLFAGFHYYTGIAYWQLKLRYPGVQNLEDAGDLLFGRGGRIVFGGCQLLFGIFLQGNHVLLGAKAFYTLGWTDTCAIALAVIFSIISFFFTLPRSYRLFSFFAFTSFASITIVCILVMIASNVTGPINAPPNAAPVTVHAFGPASGGTTTFISGMNSVSNLLVSYGAIPSYLPIMSEMRDARRFPRALKVLIGVELVLYTVVGGVIVRALGQYTTSPSLNSLNPLLAKISYGIALPVILIAGCASGQVSAKQLLLLVQRRLRMRRQAVYAQDQSAGGVPTMGKSSKKQIWIIWILVNVFTWTCAFILAEIIPFFGSFLSVESSLFWSTFILFAAVFHLWILREEKNSHDAGETDEKKTTDGRNDDGIWRPFHLLGSSRLVSSFIAIAIFGASTFLCVAGIISAAFGIRDDYATGAVGRPFSCSVA